MRGTLRFVSILFFTFLFFGNVGVQADEVNETYGYHASIMRPDAETRFRWLDEYRMAPRVIPDWGVQKRLMDAQIQQTGTSVNLLPYVDYLPIERDQGNCGNCWVWVGTGIMEIALNVQNGIRDRLSTQFFNSCKTGSYACCGGYLSDFSTWYAGRMMAIPWSNLNASFEDDSRECEDHKSAVLCGTISTFPNYPIPSIEAQVIQTTEIGQSTAIANIKNVLHQKKGVWLDFFLATQADWNAFFGFWDNQDESALWNPDTSCGHTWNQKWGGGHAVLIAGYNDDDPNPSNHHWIVLNSWGTANGNRSNGLFRMPMYMNYDCTIYETGYGDWTSMHFWKLDVSFNPSGNELPNLTPYQPQGWPDKLVVSRSSGTNTGISAFTPQDTLYVDWAVINSSPTGISTGFSVSLYVDGALRNSWHFNSLGPGDYIFINDYSIGSLSAGTHTLRIVADPDGVISEGLEGDNEYVRTIKVNGYTTGSDLTGSWVSLKQTCGNTWSGQTCKLIGSFRIKNTGNRDTVSSSVDFYLSDGLEKGTLLKRVPIGRIKAGASRTLMLSHSLPSGQSALGKYVVAVIDPDNTVAEKDESNNEIPFGPISSP